VTILAEAIQLPSGFCQIALELADVIRLSNDDGVAAVEIVGESARRRRRTSGDI
jgi:hypothetical protein